MRDVESPAVLAERLDATGYLADEGLATAAFLALRMGRPLFLEGEAGVGKTALAQALADVLGAPLIRLQCYEGIDAAQALYDWDFPRQLLHLRAAEAAGRHDADRLEAELYDRRFLIARPLLQAHRDRQPERAAGRRGRPGRRRVRGVPARGAQRLHDLGPGARHDPRGDPAGRRGDQQPHPRGARRAEAPLPLPLAGAPDVRPRGGDHPRGGCPRRPSGSPSGVAAAARRLREQDLLKPPGVAETLDWTEALLDARRAGARPATWRRATLGAVLKYREDQERVAERLRRVGGRPGSSPRRG